MKAKFNKWMRNLIGKLDGLVYYSDQIMGEVLVRDYVKPARSESNDRLARNSLNIKVFYRSCSAAYNRDLSIYAVMENLNKIQTGHKLNRYTMLTKLLYALKRMYPEVDLGTLTPDEIIAQGYPIDTVFNAIVAGILMPVTGCQNLNNRIVE
jgi:hypothetical protein